MSDDRPMDGAEQSEAVPETIVVSCPACNTAKRVPYGDSLDVIDTHDEKRHGGKQHAGVRVRYERGFVTLPHPERVTGSDRDE